MFFCERLTVQRLIWINNICRAIQPGISWNPWNFLYSSSKKKQHKKLGTCLKLHHRLTCFVALRITFLAADSYISMRYILKWQMAVSSTMSSNYAKKTNSDTFISKLGFSYKYIIYNINWVCRKTSCEVLLTIKQIADK